jgi:RNA polymerase sigma-70 factor (ECF subfamily)
MRESVPDRTDPQSLACEELMELVQGGDPRAFEVVYERHASAAYSLAYRITGTRPAAEEVVQEAFLAIWRAGGRYDRSRGSVRTWIFSIVHHRAIDAMRRQFVHEGRRSADETAAERVEAPERTEVEAVRRAEAGRVRAALDTLPPEQMRVIELAYFGGFSHTEIATMIAAPVGTVKGRMRLGLQRMRHALEEARA